MKQSHAPPQVLRHELSRTGLLERLATAMDYQVVALVAPSGYGKTTALAQFARTTPYPVAWLSLREDDADPAVFVQSLCAAVASFDFVSPSGLPPSSTLRDLATLLNNLAFSVRLVFDDVQVLGAESGRELSRFIEALTEGHQVLIGSYVDPPLRLARLVARGSALVIGLEELAFSRQESELYLRTRQFQGRPDRAYAHLSGWPVGLALVSSEASLHYQPEHLIADLIETLEPDLSGKLPEAAVMDVWEESLAQQLQLDLPPGWLDTVKRLGLPLAPLGNNRFAPHQLLLQTLLSRLRLVPERFGTLHARMAAVHQEAGDALAALRLHQRAGHFQDALALARELVNRYTERLEMSLVCRTLQDFSPDQLPVEVQLQWAGALLETGQPEAGAALLAQVQAQQDSALLRFYQARLRGSGQNYQAQLDAAEEALRTYPDALSLLRLKAHALLNLEQAEEALQTAQYALARCPVPLGVEEAQCLHLCAQCLYGLGRWQEYQRMLERALDAFTALSMPVRTLYLFNDLADLYRKQGRLPEAHDLLEQAVRTAREENSAALPMLLETLGETLLDMGDLESGMGTLRQALGICDEFGALNLQRRIRLILAEALARTDQVAQAEDQLEQAEPLNSGLRPRAEFVRGLIALVQGDAQAALARFGPLDFQAHHPLALRTVVYRRELQLKLKRVHKLSTAEAAWIQQHPAQHVLRQDAPWVTRTLREVKLQFQPTLTTPRATLHLNTLGQLRARVESRPLQIPFAKAGELLVWLALHGPASREQIVDALWDGSREERHIGYFKVVVRRLRLALSEILPDVINPLPFEAGQYALSSDFSVDLDVTRSFSSTDDEAGRLTQRLSLWQGEFLPGLTSEWIQEERRRIQDEWTVQILHEAAGVQATHPELAQQAYQLILRLDPLQVPAHHALIRLLHGRADAVAASQAYGAYSRMMRREFAEEPRPYPQVVATLD
ncbi:tetratricopeptide repeat protein [Deinococcus aquatilis]|uniref:tetratricopeptide repeat protein n=1 Tax=Deinococcus aquatilis TaxID=519440 RepID=UPI00037E2C57|nr:tetratricopeptide repeat protein [Deinococcus aquatilis]